MLHSENDGLPRRRLRKRSEPLRPLLHELAWAGAGGIQRWVGVDPCTWPAGLTVAADGFESLFVATVEDKGKPITVVYVPSHLYHMVFELFKVGFAFRLSIPELSRPRRSPLSFRTPCEPPWSCTATPWSILLSTLRSLWGMKTWLWRS